MTQRMSLGFRVLLCTCCAHLVIHFGWVFLFQAEDGIRDLVRSRGLGDVYKRQLMDAAAWIGQLLAGAPQVKLLVTSQEPLRLHEELSLIHI